MDYLIDPRELAKIIAKYRWLPGDIVRKIFDNLVRTRNIEMWTRNQARENRLYQMSYRPIHYPGLNFPPTDFWYYHRYYGPGF